MKTRLKNEVTRVPTEPAPRALKHFEARLAHEADCWDVHATEELEDRGFVLLDVRSKEAFGRGHLPGATHLPHWKLSEKSLADYPTDTLFVVYCAGPHCNASTKAAIHLSRFGRPVKEMVGGVCGWLDEGFELETT